jgi:hypothetical protein
MKVFEKIMATTGPVQSSKDEALTRGKRIATLDDTMMGNLLAQEAWAFARSSHQTWRSMGFRLIEMNHEARDAFVKAVKGLTTEAKKANKLDGDVDKKEAGKRVATATVECSKLRIIAESFNGAATVTGLCEYVKQATKCKQDVSIDDVSYTMLVEYARTFSTSKKGRPALSWVAKMGKWLEMNPIHDDSDQTDVDAYNAILGVYNGLTSVEPAPF